MSAYRQLTDLLTAVEGHMHIGRMFWQRVMRAPAPVVESAVHAMAEDGYISHATMQSLLPYTHSASRTTIERRVRLLADCADLVSWQRHRIVITPDADLWADLGGVADSDVLAAEVFKYLPYANPFIHFPTPIVLATGSPDRRHRVVGAFVYGIRTQRSTDGSTRNVACSTDDPRAYTLAFKYAGVITDSDGNQLEVRPEWDNSLVFPDFVWTYFVLHFHAPTATFGELAAQAAARFVNRDHAQDGVLADPQISAQAAAGIARQVLAFVLYLCCSNADLEVRRPAARSRNAKRRQAQAKPPVLVAAGFRVGAAIRAWRAQRDAAQPGAPTGRKVKPHPRRGHFQRFRYGKGRALLTQPKYVSMLWVNARLGGPDLTTIKPVKP